MRMRVSWVYSPAARAKTVTSACSRSHGVNGWMKPGDSSDAWHSTGRGGAFGASVTEAGVYAYFQSAELHGNDSALEHDDTLVPPTSTFLPYGAALSHWPFSKQLLKFF